ncbi:MAG: ABC transporter ATP-binding protein [Chloroflexi bacterium]|nr:ABC transporter ATP-binding protein [Chloroflexota bacterium]
MRPWISEPANATDPTTAESSTSAAIVRQELRRRWRAVALTAGLMLGGAAVSIVPALLVAALIDRALPGGNLGLTAVLAGGMAGAALVLLILASSESYMRASIGEAVSRRLRQQAFDGIAAAQLAELEQVPSEQLVFRLTRSCGRIGEWFVAESLLPAVSQTLVLVASLSAMLVLAWPLGLLALVAIPAMTLGVARLGPLSTRLERRFGRHLERGQIFLQEVLAGIRVVRVFDAAERERGRWLRWLDEHWRVKAKTFVLHDVVIAHSGAAAQALVTAAAFGIGAVLIAGDHLTLGGLIAAVALVPRAYVSLQRLLTLQANRARVEAEYERMDDVFGLAPERAGGRTPQLPADDSGTRVAFQDANFRYAREDAGVFGVSFSVQPGQFLGIVGETGSGKSTLLDLLVGLYAPHSGSVRVDGIDTREIDLSWLRRQIGLVPQEPRLWDATIADNIRYPAGLAGADELARALRDAQLDDFLARLPQGIETTVGEQGHSISAGERQRIAIARALLRDPRLLILDEATASLDAATEQDLRRALASSRRGRTLIVVTHRIESVMGADRIVVMDRGRVLEQGTPENLLQAGGRLAGLRRAQTSDAGADRPG